MPKRAYKVLAGTHTDETGKRYVKDEVVISETELDKVFENKFERVDFQQAQQSAVAEEESRERRVRSAAVAGPTEDSMQGTDHPERGTGNKRMQAARKKVEEEDEQEAQQREEAETEGDGDFGIDVTDRFENAAECGYQVFKGPEGYVIVDVTEPTKPLMEAVRNKKQISKFIEENQSPDDEEETEASED